MPTCFTPPQPFQAHQASQNIFVFSEQTGSLADLEAVVQGWLWLKNHQDSFEMRFCSGSLRDQPQLGLTAQGWSVPHELCPPSSLSTPAGTVPSKLQAHPDVALLELLYVCVIMFGLP